MNTFFKKTFRDFKWSILIYSFIVLIYGTFLVSFYPSMKGIAADFEKLMESFPKAFIEAFGMNEKSFSNLEGFLSVEYFSLMWILILAFFIFSLGASIVSGEIDKGTGEFSFTLPIRRTKVVLGKFLASGVITLGIIIFSLVTIIIVAAFVGEPVSLKGFFDFFLLGCTMSFFLLSFATFFSTVLSSKGNVYGVCGGFFVFSYLIHVLHGISDKLDSVYYLSFMKYYGSPQPIIAGKGIDMSNLSIFLLAGAFFLIASLVVVERRDL